MSPDVTAFFHEPTNTVSYVVSDPSSGVCAVIDPVRDYEPNAGRTGTVSADEIIAFVRSRELTTAWIIETHAHADHLTAAQYLKEALGGRVAIGEKITTVRETFGRLFNAGDEFRRDGSQFDHLFADGERYRIGGLEARALHTPGHTPACMTHVIGDAAFVGDTLFMPDYGTARADFPGGDARTLYRSIRRIFELPEDMRLFLCHDYLPEGRRAYRWETSVGAEKAENIHVHEGVSEEDFVTMRTARDRTLGMPRLILPSIQVNMRAGHLPPPEENGIRYLKIPLDAL